MNNKDLSAETKADSSTNADKTMSSQTIANAPVSSRFIIGVATGSGDIETWLYDDIELSEKLCKRIVSNTGMSVYVIEGKIIGKYHFQEPPIIFTPSKNGC
jgi:hypothetical protein